MRPNHKAAETLQQDDYLAYNGAGLSIHARYHFTRQGTWYAGPGLSIEYIAHKAFKSKIGEPGNHMEPYYNVDASHGRSTGLFMAFGRKGLIRAVSVEPYLILGKSYALLQRTVYSSTSPYAYKNAVFPLTMHNSRSYINLSIGIKVGFGFKKNARQAAIERKFKGVYLPRYDTLYRRYHAIPDRTVKGSRPLKLAKKFIRAADKQMQKVYKRHYRDTAAMYNRIDAYLQNIDRLLLPGNGKQE